MYSEHENGHVTLTMERAEYERLMLALGYATGVAMQQPDGGLSVHELLLLVNRLNAGNPDFRPYQIEQAAPEADVKID